MMFMQRLAHYKFALAHDRYSTSPQGNCPKISCPSERADVIGFETEKDIPVPIRKRPDSRPAQLRRPRGPRN